MNTPSDHLLDRFAPVQPILPGDPIRLHHADRVFDLWEAWETESKAACPVPFWAVAWPAARVLTRYIRRHPELVKGKTVLDVGCGCGLVSIACCLAGAAQVIANDTDGICLTMARANALINNAVIEFNGGDLLTRGTLPAAEVVLIADMFYTKKQAQQLARLLQDYKAAGALVLIADGGRDFVPATGIKELHSETIPVDHQLENTGLRVVRILEFTG